MLEGVVAAGLEVRELHSDPVFILPACTHRDHAAEQSQLVQADRDLRQHDTHPYLHGVAGVGLKAMGGDALHGRSIAEYLQAGQGDVGGDSRETATVISDDAYRMLCFDAVEGALFF